MSFKKLALPVALSLSMASCVPAPMRDYLSMYGYLRDPVRRSVADVLLDGNNMQVDPVSRTYTVSSTVAGQFGTNYHCTFTPTDLVDVSTLDRHIAGLRSSIQTARTENQLSQGQVGSACWCLQLMQSVRATLISGRTTFSPQQFPYCTNACMCSVPRMSMPPLPDNLNEGGIFVN